MAGRLHSGEVAEPGAVVIDQWCIWGRSIAYGVVTIGDETFVLHAHDYLDASPRFPFGKTGVDDREYALGEWED